MEHQSQQTLLVLGLLEEPTLLELCYQVNIRPQKERENETGTSVMYNAMLCDKSILQCFLTTLDSVQAEICLTFVNVLSSQFILLVCAK